MTSLSNISISIDAMSGDHGPKVVVPAVFEVLKEFSNVNVILVGKEEELLSHINKYSDVGVSKRITIQNATEVVSMDDHPGLALRNKKDSSMRVALNLVNDGEAQACVSAGNTGALMVTARYVLKTLSGIDRPAIISRMPSKSGIVYVLDLGANVECQSEHLFQFAVMGSILVSARHGMPKPKVGLLNIGSEAIKGTDAVKSAAEQLDKCSGINYIGFVEGNDIYQGKANVVVCDGFAGNVALKTSEGLANMFVSRARKEFTRNLYTKMIGLLAKPIFTRLYNFFDPNEYNGGSLLGLRGVVIKSHGGAKEKAFASAIKVAIIEAEKNVPTKISEQVTSLLQDSI